MSEDQKLQRIFKGYLNQSNVSADIADKIIKLAQNFELKDKAKQFLQRFENVLKKSFDQKNPKLFVTVVKRFLYVINRILESDAKKESGKQYTNIISEQIIQYYLFFFSIIFKHSLNQLIMELKMSRMKWLKRITQKSFIRLKQQILHKHKFNLDKGFSEQNIEKLKIIYKKRGLNQKQINKYLGLQSIDQKPTSVKRNTANISSSSSSSHSDYEYDQMQKKLKMDYNFSRNNIEQMPLYNHYQSFQSNKSQFDPRVPQNYDPRINRQTNAQFTYTQPNNINSYFPYPVQNQNYHSNPNYAINTPNPLYLNINNSVISNKQQTQIYENKKNDSIQKVNLLRLKLQNNSIKCKQCGMLFETNYSYEKHTTQHFFDSLAIANQNQNKGKIKKQSKLILFDIKSWETDVKINQKEFSFEVLLSDLQNLKLEEKNKCLFCNEQFQTKFSQEYEQWVLSDAIKLSYAGKLSIVHFQCYECFKSEENSPLDK